MERKKKNLMIESSLEYCRKSASLTARSCRLRPTGHTRHARTYNDILTAAVITYQLESFASRLSRSHSFYDTSRKTFVRYTHARKMGTSFDAVAQRDAQDAKMAFLDHFTRAKEDIVSFVDSRLGWKQAGKFLGYLSGSFNISIVVQNGETDERALIRFLIPGKVYKPWLEQKVKNEVMVLKYISCHTDIPIPKVHHWGLTEESPCHMGPFIIEEFMEGEDLGELLREPSDNDEDLLSLDPDIDNTKLDFVYEQIASFQLQLSRLEFPDIGAISMDGKTGEGTVTGTPLTYDMNEVVGFASFPARSFTATKPFTKASDYFLDRARCMQINLETHRNIGNNLEVILRLYRLQMQNRLLIRVLASMLNITTLILYGLYATLFSISLNNYYKSFSITS